MNARFPPIIAGAGGDDKPTEAKNSLKSKQVARVVDLLSEGPIRGVVGDLKGVLFDGTAVMKSDGNLNFENASIQFMDGYPNQPIMKGFTSQQAEVPVSTQLRYNVPITRTILNTDCDRTRLTLSVPTLQKAESDGDIKGTSVSFNVYCQSDGGGFKKIGDFKIEGKTTSKYQRAVVFDLPRTGPWDIRVTRLTADSSSAKLQNDLYWDSYTEIIDDRVNYSHSAVVGIQIDARQFQSIPTRTYLTEGLLCKIPSNYNPFTAVYTGVWSGTFNFEWTDNPAWVFYDLVTNSRYGIGDFISEAMVDKWSLYTIGKWCDQLIPDGKGGTQRRYRCNIQIMDQQEAYDLLQQMATIFRGFTYWTGGQMITVADMPSDPVMQFTNANVIGGQFSYAGGDGRARRTMASVSWRDPDYLGETRLAIVENQSQISRLGIQKAEITAVGTTDEAQAIRVGKWALYTEEFESETVQFSAGLDSAWCRPGDIIQISDVLISGSRRGGRTGSGSTASVVVLDAAVTRPITSIVYLSCVIGEGTVETRPVILIDGDHITVSPAFSAAPAPGSTFVVNADNENEPTLWRVIGSRQADAGTYDLSAMKHLPDKWDHIEKNIVLSTPDTSDIKVRPDGVTGIEMIEYLVQTSPISVGVHVTLSWISDAPTFEVSYRRQDDNWTTQRIDATAIDLEASEGIWEFLITPISPVGLKGPTSTYARDIIGRFAPPAAPVQFRINVVDSVAMFHWLPATEIDVIIGGHYELRFSSRTEDADWYTAQTVVPSIPGSATSIGTGYQPGTWFLRTYDIVGVPSETWAVIIALLPDQRYVTYARICEQPDWAGVHDNTVIQLPQEWLTIDTIATVPGTFGTGAYFFDHIIDAGGIFSVRLSADILAFQFAEPDEFIDSRLDDCDTWEDWDNAGASYGGEVTILISQTDEDPATPSPLWTPWKIFIAGEHYARAFRFQALLTAPAGQNIGVEELCILADLRTKIEEGADVPYPAATTRVTFRLKFYAPPSVVVTVQNALETDRIQIVAKTETYFDLKITNTAGVHQTRTFDWHAQGY